MSYYIVLYLYATSDADAPEVVKEVAPETPDVDPTFKWLLPKPSFFITNCLAFTKSLPDATIRFSVPLYITNEKTIAQHSQQTSASHKT